MKHWLAAFIFLCACSSDDSSTSPPTSSSGGTDGGSTSDASELPDGNTGEVTPPRRVFVTQALRTGANGGTDGADAVCALEAKNAMLVGTFVAWLSTPASKAIDKLRTDAAFMTTDGKILWQSRAEIEAGTGPQAPITADAHGKAVTGIAEIWTGADGNG